MPSVPIQISRGWNTSAAFGRQPPGTFRTGQNCRPRNWMDGGKEAAAQRPGFTRFIDDPLCDGSRITSIASGRTTTQVGQITLGTMIFEDTFTEGSDTAYGTLGDRASPAGDDYTLCSGVTGGGTILLDSATVVGDWDFPTDAVNEGPYVNATVDGVRDDASVVGTFTNMRVFGCILNQTNAAMSGSLGTVYGMEISFKTSTTDNNQRGYVGLICNANRGTLGGGARDDCTMIGYRFAYDSALATAMEVTREINNAASPNIPANIYNDSSETLSLDTEYTIRLLVDGSYGELYLKTGSGEFELKQAFSNIRMGGSTVYAATGSDIGFFFGSSGAANTHALQWVDNFRVYQATSTQFTDRTVILATCEDEIHVIDSGEAEVVTNGSGLLEDDADTCAFVGPGTDSDGNLYAYFLDGTNYARVPFATLVAEAWTASTGTLPQGNDTTKKCRYGTLWRNRAVLWGLLEFPRNWYMSRAGNLRDFNYTAASDGKEARAGDNSGAGMLAQPISCLAAFDADRLIMASMEQMWMMVGDPAQGGIITSVTDKNGICGPYASARDDEGNFYFVSLHGLFVIPTAGGAPIPLSTGRVDDYFDALDYEAATVRLTWNRHMNGLHVFVEPEEEGEVTHLWWDKIGGLRAGGAMFPDIFGDTAIGPTAVAEYVDPSDPDRAVILVGGWDGRIRYVDPLAKNDDASAIDSYAQVVLSASEVRRRALLSEISVLAGQNNDSIDWSIRAASTPELLESASARASGVLTGTGHRPSILRRIGDTAIGLRIGNDELDEFWCAESIVATIEDAGVAIGRVS